MNRASDPLAVKPPARWLVATIIILLCLTGLLVNRWVERERRATEPSLVSGQPGFKVEFLSDPSCALTFDDILVRAGSGGFLASRKGEGRERCVWYRLTLSNESGFARLTILGISKEFTQDAMLYTVGADGRYRVQRTGGTVRWAERSVPAYKPAFAVELPAHSQRVLYMRVTDSIKQPEAFLLWNDEHTFNRLNELYKLVYVGYFSLWIGLLAYNGFLYAVLRRRDYLFYLFYLLSMGAAIVTSSDLSTVILPWPHWPLRGIVVIVCLNLTTFNLVRFSRVFLDTAARAPIHDRWLMRLGWVVLGASLASPAWLWPGAAVGYEALDLALNIVVMAALPVLGLTLFYRRNSQAGLYVLTFLPLVAAVIYALKGNFGMPEARVNGAPVLSANALELVLLALALAWRYRRINDEALGLRSEYTARLEDEVTLRTRELRESNTSLARANRDKDRIFGIIGHDLRGPAQSLFGLAQILSADPDAFSPQESASMAKEIEATCRNQLELLENLLLWGRMQSGGLRVRPEPQAAADIVGACTGALMPAIRSKNITFAIEIEPGLTFNADSQAAQAVVRNLLVNALKFTRSGGKITVAALRKDDRMELSVQDNGVGMSAARLGELFAGPVESMAGTRSETGAGVGLILCRDLARANGGDLRIESEPGSGTKVTLILPVSIVPV